MSSSVDIGAATAASRGLYLAHPLKNHDIQFESTRKNLPTGPLCFFFSFKLADSLDRDPESLPNCGMEAVALSSCLEEEELDELRRPPSPSSQAMSVSVVVSGEVGRHGSCKNGN